MSSILKPLVFNALKLLCKALHKAFYGKQKIMQSNQQKTSWVNLNALLLFINTLHKYVPDNSKHKQETFEKVYI